MISIESVPVTPAWFEDLFGKPPYADGLSGSGSMDDGSVMAYTMEQIMNGSNHQFRATTPYWSISRQLYMNCTGNDTIGANMSIRDSSSVIPTLYDTDGGFVCSGTLIHPHWVLTSASCSSATLQHRHLCESLLGCTCHRRTRRASADCTRPGH